MITIKTGDCRDVLKEIPNQTFNCVVTSPPYWGLRDYNTGTWEGGDPNCPHKRLSKISKDTSTGHLAMHDQGDVVGDAIYKKKCPLCGAVRKDKQVGLEENPHDYVKNMVNIFKEIKRVLRDDGTVWLNLGDTYSSYKDSKSTSQTVAKGTLSEEAHIMETNHSRNMHLLKRAGFKNKELIGIPWRVAFALQEDGWYLRQDIIWSKPNPMPESVKDRCTKSHEYIFLLTKQSHYYFNPLTENNGTEIKNKRSVWNITPASLKETHFAVFPTSLVEPCILAGCPEDGNVLDPFGGAGTTALVADRLKRNATIIELNPKYINIAEKRINNDAPLFTTLTVEKGVS